MTDTDRLLAAMAWATDAVVVIDGEGVVQLLGPSVLRLLGLEEEVVVGSNVLDHIHPDDVQFAAGATVGILTAELGHTGAPVSVRVQDGQGRWRPVTVRGTNRLADPAIRGVVLTVRDETGLALQQQADASAADQFRSVVELSPDGVWIVDAEARTTYASGRMAAILGWAPQDMEGRPLTEFMDDEGRSDFDGLWERRQLGISEAHPFRFVHRDGSSVWTTVSTTPVLDAAGTFTGAVALVSDRTTDRFGDELLATLAGLVLDEQGRVLARFGPPDGSVDPWPRVRVGDRPDVPDGVTRIALADGRTAVILPPGSPGRAGG